MKNLIEWLACQKLFYAFPLIGHSLLKFYNDPASLLRGSLAEICAVLGEEEGKKWFLQIQNVPLKDCEKEFEVIENLKAQIIPIPHPDYPPLLRQIPDPPLVIVARGKIETWKSLPMIAIVGSRKATAYGKTRAIELAKGLAQYNVGVVSGLAYGIDSKAHEGALQGEGCTWGVMATGIETIYPAHHEPLAEKMEVKGGILTEFPVGVTPWPSHFPQRNRIISGMSLGTVVVEAAAQSGSLITARLALEQGREVFAVPGPVGHLSTQGTHHLIKQGAKLVEGAWDIVAEFPQLQTTKEDSSEDSLQNKILQFISKTPKSIEQLAFEVGISIETLLSELTLLECEMKICRIAGAQFVRK